MRWVASRWLASCSARSRAIVSFACDWHASRSPMRRAIWALLASHSAWKWAICAARLVDCASRSVCSRWISSRCSCLFFARRTWSVWRSPSSVSFWTRSASHWSASRRSSSFFSVSARSSWLASRCSSCFFSVSARSSRPYTLVFMANWRSSSSVVVRSCTRAALRAARQSWKARCERLLVD